MLANVRLAGGEWQQAVKGHLRKVWKGSSFLYAWAWGSWFLNNLDFMDAVKSYFYPFGLFPPFSATGCLWWSVFLQVAAHGHLM